jgi:hypothetical protein
VDPARSVRLALALALGAATAAQTGPVELTVQAGRPLRVALLERVKLRRVGQRVAGTLVEPVYAYDRVVLPAGTKVGGRIAKLERVTGGARLHAILGGDFTPLKRAVLEFDALVMADGSEIPVRTVVKSATERIALETTETARKKGLAGRVGEGVSAPARAAVAAARRPGRMRRLKEAIVSRLPYHPQYLDAGTVYTAVLLAPLEFGTVDATPLAAGTALPPEGILRGRLLTAIGSASTPRGTAIQAVITQPVFSEDHQLILPEGAILRGEVTFAKAAGAFHRNGRLRFLFESLQAPEQGPETLRASLYSAEVSRDQRLAIDDEGGATVTGSKARFAAPVVAGLALGLTMRSRWDYDTDGAGPELQYGSAQSRGAGGFFGLGLLGAGLSQLSRPVAVGLGIAGLARTAFSAVAGKGKNVSFPADTVIEVQLGRGPRAAGR